MMILIVDDQPNIARVTGVALQTLGCQALVASSIRAAKHLLATEKIDAVLLDVHLAGESGLDFLSELSASPGPLPVVISTALAGPEIAGEARRRGAFDCLAKPYSLDDLRTQIAAIADFLHRTAATPTAPRRVAP